MHTRYHFMSHGRLLIIFLSLALLVACVGGSGSGSGTHGLDASSSPVATITAAQSVAASQAGYAASVPTQSGCAYSWEITNGTIMVGANTESIAFTPGTSGSVTLTCTVTNASGASTTGTATCTITAARAARHTLADAHSFGAQTTTLAFACFGMMTGNLAAQTFFPPGKVADYWGFQYLRDNDGESDTTGMGHNTSFLTRVACNMLYILNDSQITLLKNLAGSQVANINRYAWKRYPLMKAFRLLMDDTAHTLTLNEAAVKAASVELYQLDGQLSFERAVVYANIYRSFTAEQKAYVGAMVGKSWVDWPDKLEDDVRDKTQGLTHDEVVAMMTYAGDLYSWYAGNIASDVYYCPERHGTYYGSFYIKDAPAVGHPGYSISTSMTADVGRYLTDSTQGYVSAAGAAKMNAMATTQLANLYTTPNYNIEYARTMISQALRSLITSAAPSQATLDTVQNTVEYWSQIYGELDGKNNYLYAKTFAELYNNINDSGSVEANIYMSAAQKAALAAKRTTYMTVTWNGTTTDYTLCSTYFLFAANVSPSSTDFINYTSNSATSAFFN